MQRNTPWSRWQRWRQAFVFGLSLALLELSLFVVSMAYSGRLLPSQALLIGIPLYLVVPAIAGYWRCRQGQHEGWESDWAGFRVGFVGFAVFILAVALIFAAMFMRYITTPHTFTPQTSHQWGLYDPAGELTTLATNLGILVVFNSVGLLLSAVGGRIGGTLAILLAKRLQQSPEHDV